MRHLFTTIFLFVISFDIRGQVTLNLKLFIEGYYTGNGMMDNYGSGGCLLASGVSTNPNDADTITVSLVEPQHLNVVETVKGILQTDGTVTLNFSNTNSGGSYFISVQHRSALKTWSAIPVVMNSASSYDFTTSASMAFGNNMIKSYDQMSWMFYSGDIYDASNLQLGNCFQDGVIDTFDYILMENSILLTGYKCQDVTGDGVVEAADYLTLENAYSAGRLEVSPNPIGIEEFVFNQSSSAIIKCISINGRLQLNAAMEWNDQKNISIFDLNGREIFMGELKNLNEQNFGFQLKDGIYFIRILN